MAPSLPSLPSPKEILSQAASFFRGQPLSSVLDEKDAFGFLLLGGDVDDSHHTDLRLYLLRRGDGGLVAHEVVPAHDVPITEALGVAHDVAGLLPVQAQIPVKMALGAASAAAGALERIALK